MTTIDESELKCDLCGHVWSYYGLSSFTVYNNPPDLDGRPREGIFAPCIGYGMMSCPECGYCSYYVGGNNELLKKLKRSLEPGSSKESKSDLPARYRRLSIAGKREVIKNLEEELILIQEVLSSADYKRILNDKELSETANHFRCAAMIKEALGDYRTAADYYKIVSWLSPRQPEQANLYRKRAVEYYLKDEESAKEQGKKFKRDFLILADLLRQAGEFEEAMKYTEEELRSARNKQMKNLLKYEKVLIEMKDTLPHDRSILINYNARMALLGICNLDDLLNLLKSDDTALKKETIKKIKKDFEDFHYRLICSRQYDEQKEAASIDRRKNQEKTVSEHKKENDKEIREEVLQESSEEMEEDYMQEPQLSPEDICLVFQKIGTNTEYSQVDSIDINWNDPIVREKTVSAIMECLVDENHIVRELAELCLNAIDETWKSNEKASRFARKFIEILQKKDIAARLTAIRLYALIMRSEAEDIILDQLEKVLEESKTNREPVEIITHRDLLASAWGEFSIDYGYHNVLFSLIYFHCNPYPSDYNANIDALLFLLINILGFIKSQKSIAALEELYLKEDNAIGYVALKNLIAAGDIDVCEIFRIGIRKQYEHFESLLIKMLSKITNNDLLKDITKEIETEDENIAEKVIGIFSNLLEIVFDYLLPYLTAENRTLQKRILKVITFNALKEDPVLTLLRDSDEICEKFTARLRKIGISEIIREALVEEDDEFRRVATVAVRLLRLYENLKDIESALRDRSPDIRSKALLTFVLLDKKRVNAMIKKSESPPESSETDARSDDDTTEKDFHSNLSDHPSEWSPAKEATVSEQAKNHLISALKDEDDGVKITAICIASDYKIIETIEPLLKMLDTAKGELLEKVIVAFRFLKVERAIPYLEKFTHSEDNRLANITRAAIEDIKKPKEWWEQ